MDKDQKFSQLLDYLVDHRSPGVPAAEFGSIIDALIWITNDNGGQVCATCESWLLGHELYRIEIALSVQNVFFFKSQKEMEDAFSLIIQRWPFLRDTCDEISRRRRASCYPGGNNVVPA